jgi:hypothetical protein
MSEKGVNKMMKDMCVKTKGTDLLLAVCPLAEKRSRQKGENKRSCGILYGRRKLDIPM